VVPCFEYCAGFEYWSVYSIGRWWVYWWLGILVADFTSLSGAAFFGGRSFAQCLFYGVLCDLGPVFAYIGSWFCVRLAHGFDVHWQPVQVTYKILILSSRVRPRSGRPRVDPSRTDTADSTSRHRIQVDREAVGLDSGRRSGVGVCP
jgi:hypothetical protein